MELTGGNPVKAQVVYYLSRNGKMEPPHMIEVPYLPSEGLRLRDVTCKLTMLRGSAMRNMFSWSYKRSYKNRYIWLDLSEEEIIVPGSSGEYVLKGSELFDDCQDKTIKYVSNQESDSCKHPEVLQCKYRGAETWLKHDVSKYSPHQFNPSFLKHEVTEKGSRFSQGNLNTVRNHSHKKLFQTDSTQTLARGGALDGLSAPDDFLNDNKISSSSELSDSSTKQMTDIRNFPITSTISSAHHGCTDAATQTNLDTDNGYEALAEKDNEITGSTNPWKALNIERYALNHYQAEANSISPMTSGELIKDQNSSHKKKHSKEVDACLLQDKDSSENVRLKHTTASRVFLQLLSCGGVDTKVQQEMANAEKEGRAPGKKSDLWEQRGGLLPSEISLPSKTRDKPETLRGHQCLQSSRSGRKTAPYFCGLELDNGHNHESLVHTIPRISEIDEELLSTLPSPSHEANSSKLDRRCSSFSSSW